MNPELPSQSPPVFLGMEIKGRYRPLWKAFHKGRYRQFDEVETGRSAGQKVLRQLLDALQPFERRGLAGSCCRGAGVASWLTPGLGLSSPPLIDIG